MKDRPALLAKLDTRLREIEEQHARLCDDARAAGVGVELLPDEASRRTRVEQRKAWVRSMVAANRGGIERGKVRALGSGITDAEFREAVRELGIVVPGETEKR